MPNRFVFFFAARFAEACGAPSAQRRLKRRGDQGSRSARDRAGRRLPVIK
jgi:hypothetical protein